MVFQPRKPDLRVWALQQLDSWEQPEAVFSRPDEVTLTHTHTHTHARTCPSRLSTAKVTDISLSVPLHPAQAGREALSSDSGSGGGRLHLCSHENHPGGKVASDTMTLKVTRITPPTLLVPA